MRGACCPASQSVGYCAQWTRRPHLRQPGLRRRGDDPVEDALHAVLHRAQIANEATTGAWSELGASILAVGSVVIDGSGWLITAPAEVTSTTRTSRAETRMWSM